MIVIYVIGFIFYIVIAYMIAKEAFIAAIKTLIDDENFVEKLKKILNEYE